MVIMWINNNQVILSQRKAPTEEMPTVDASPPRTATLASSLSVVSKVFPNSHPELMFSAAFNHQTRTGLHDSRERVFRSHINMIQTFDPYSRIKILSKQ
jgi:hypothetical protein